MTEKHMAIPDPTGQFGVPIMTVYRRNGQGDGPKDTKIDLETT